MKLWEVLKALDENPKKVFECDTGSRIKFLDNRLHWYDKHGNPKEVFEIRDKRSGTGICHNTGDFWQEIKQPVPWKEAFEAWLNGTPVFCILENGKKVEYDQNINFIHAHSLKTGTWYIED